MNITFVPDYEKVEHPAHYNAHPSGVECIDIIEHFPHNIGAAIKYCWRAGLKPDAKALTDLKKAAFYINREVARLQQPNRRKQDPAAISTGLRVG